MSSKTEATLRQRLRCRRGKHDWRRVFKFSKSNLMTCRYCHEVGYEINEG